MRRPNADKQTVRCQYFVWIVGKRNGTYYADGRGNDPALGRFSLGSTNYSEAVENLKELDRIKAVETGKADRTILSPSSHALTLTEGRRLYEGHIDRPAVTGGTRATTRKRYRAVLDKFLEFAKSKGLEYWSQINRRVLEQYAAQLEKDGYSYNTQYLELTTLKQINKWLIGEGHLPESCRIVLKLPRDKESTTYCWAIEEFQAIVAYCQQNPELNWLAEILLTLGLTGMRISELAQLRWSNLNISDNPMITLVDESRRGSSRDGRSHQTTKNKRSRTFPVNQQLIPMLKSLKRKPDGHVFHGPLGGRVKPDTLRNILIKDVLQPLKGRFPAAAGEKGFEDGRLHSFRHFFCSQCANNSVPERVLMTWLGHSDASMIKRYYHLSTEESQRQMDRVSIPVVNAGNGTTSAVN